MRAVLTDGHVQTVCAEVERVHQPGLCGGQVCLDRCPREGHIRAVSLHEFRGPDEVA